MGGAIRELRREVLGGPLCTACGACVGLCPYVVAVGDQIACVEECRKDTGRCYRYCPRSGAEGVDATVDALQRDTRSPVGTVRYLRLARAAVPPHVRGPDPTTAVAWQHGGVVSALLAHALRSTMIDTAVLAGGSDGVAVPVSVTDAEEVAACAGSKFGLAPTLAEVNRVLRGGARSVGVVALPCQATALRRMREDAGQGVAVGGVSPADGVQVVIGLFCTWALGQRAWRALRGQRIGPIPLVRLDVPPPPADVLVAELADGSLVDVPLDIVRSAVRPACRVCADMTAEHADISVGMAEGDPGWNTVVVRTPAGERLLEEGVAAGAVEVCEPAATRVEHLAEASAGKKLRAAIEARDWVGDVPYLSRLRVGRSG